MAIQSNFEFDMRVSFLYGNENIAINNNRILNLVINRDYLNKNMPTIYLTLSVESDLYTDIANHMKDGYFILKISKYDKNNSSNSKIKYLNTKFNYICDPDRGKIMNNNELNKEDYHTISIGLYLQSIVDNNKKKIINGVFKNTNTISIIHYFTKHMKMVIENFDNNRNIPLLIIPPLDSITHLLEFLNSVSVFYNTEYIYFMDYDYTYLISGKATEIDLKDGSYNTINISIIDNDVPGKDQGITIDSKKKYYSFTVDRRNIDITIDRTIDNKLNVLSGVSSTGFTSTANITSNKINDSGNKTSYIRVHNDNLSYIKQMQKTLESNSIILTVTRVGLDPSVFTPNKIYNIKDNAKNTELNGKYKLIGRKEIYTYNTNYVCITILTLAKIF